MESQEEQELMMKLQMFEQQIRQLQEQMQAVENGIAELSSLHLGLEDMKGAGGKEILAPVGRGMFIKTKLLSEELFVDIGEKNFVKKTIPGSQKIIASQVKKLEELKKELANNLEKINAELTNTFMATQKKT